MSRTTAAATTIAAAVLVAAMALTGCSSGGAVAPPSTAPVSTPSTSASAPSTSAAPTIGLPSPTSTATKPAKQYAVPKGAHPVATKYCSDVITQMADIQGGVDGMLYAYATARAVVLYNLQHDYKSYAKNRNEIITARAEWIKAGYKPSFPSVRDMDQMITAAADLLTASKKVDPTPLPEIYQRFNTAYDQYGNDTSDAICPG